MVVLEDLAAQFHLHAQEAINRVEGLEKMGRITGVIDDRGKFIYIETEEMEKVRPRDSLAAIVEVLEQEVHDRLYWCSRCRWPSSSRSVGD